MTSGLARIGAALGSGLAELADLVLARACAGCDVSGSSWCASCAAELGGPVVTRDVAGLSVWSGAPYEGVVREAINGWKDHGRADLTPVFADRLAEVLAEVLVGSLVESLAEIPAEGVAGVQGQALDTAPPHPGDHAPSAPVPTPAPTLVPALVPVPSSRASRRARGREPVRELALATASRVRDGGLVVLPALAQQRRVAEQAGLGAGQRARNLDGALAVPRGWARHVAGRPVVVVDDVVTSGATLREATRALVAAGAQVVGAVSVAATARRLPFGSRGDVATRTSVASSAGPAGREGARRID